MKFRVYIILFVLATVLSVSSCSDEREEQVENSNNVQKDDQEILLSDYLYEIEFESNDDINSIKKSYNIDEKEEIDKFIYAPIVDDNEKLYKEKTKYKIEKLTEVEINNDLIYSSSFEVPGGKAIIDREIITSNDFRNKCDKKELKSALDATYNFDTAKEYNIKKEYEIQISKGEKRDVKAYEIVKKYTYKVKRKSDIIGDGTIKKPIGILIVIY